MALMVVSQLDNDHTVSLNLIKKYQYNYKVITRSKSNWDRLHIRVLVIDNWLNYFGGNANNNKISFLSLTINTCELRRNMYCYCLSNTLATENC